MEESRISLLRLVGVKGIHVMRKRSKNTLFECHNNIKKLYIFFGCVIKILLTDAYTKLRGIIIYIILNY